MFFSIHKLKLNSMTEVKRVNTINPSTGLQAIGIACKKNSTFYNVKFANGFIERIHTEDIIFFGSCANFKKSYLVSTQNWMLN